MSKEKANAKEIVTEASAEALAELAQAFPQGDSYNRTVFPKLVFKSQTVLDDDENVKIKAGTFFVERPTEEEDENGKVIWDSKELGKSIEAHIIYHRKRLTMWDGGNEVFYSTRLFDESTEVVPLFKKGDFITDGTPSELKSLYSEEKEVVDFKTGEKKMKMISNLRDAKVLYILLDGELVELTIQGSSMWSFMEYLKKTAVPATITGFNSTKEEKGSNKWNKMSFKALRNPTAEEATLAIETGKALLEGIADEKAYYASKRAEQATVAPVTPVAELPAPETAEEDF